MYSEEHSCDVSEPACDGVTCPNQRQSFSMISPEILCWPPHIHSHGPLITKLCRWTPHIALPFSSSSSPSAPAQWQASFLWATTVAFLPYLFSAPVVLNSGAILYSFLTTPARSHLSMLGDISDCHKWGVCVCGGGMILTSSWQRPEVVIDNAQDMSKKKQRIIQPQTLLMLRFMNTVVNSQRPSCILSIDSSQCSSKKEHYVLLHPMHEAHLLSHN